MTVNIVLVVEHTLPLIICPRGSLIVGYPRVIVTYNTTQYLSMTRRSVRYVDDEVLLIKRNEWQVE